MKITLLVVVMCLISVWVVARDLKQAARREQARRVAVDVANRPVRLFTDQDLERYHRRTADTSSPKRNPSPSASGNRSPSQSHSDLAKKQEAYWRKEKERHRLELARLDARLRRLEWRLADRRSRRRPGERLQEDPVEAAIVQSLNGLMEERERLIEEFLERGRKEGALPGWLR